METRLPPDQIAQGLKSKSPKIRALALGGYDRTEIAEHPDIHYQHVLKVMLDSDLGGGLCRQLSAEREQLTVEVMPEPRQTTSWEYLVSPWLERNIISTDQPIIHP